MADYSYPIRYTIPLNQPGTPPQMVRFPAVQEFVYDVGAFAANALYVSPIIDLGPPEERVASWIIAHKYGFPDNGQVLTVQSSYDGISWFHLPQANGSVGFAWTNVNNWEMVVQARPMFRKVRVLFLNSTTAQTNLKIHVVLLSGV